MRQQPPLPIPSPLKDNFDQEEWETLHVALFWIVSIFLVVDSGIDSQRELAFIEYVETVTTSDDDLIRGVFRTLALNRDQVIALWSADERTGEAMFQDAASIIDRKVSESQALALKATFIGMANAIAVAGDRLFATKASTRDRLEIAKIESWLGLDAMPVESSPNRSDDRQSPPDQLKPQDGKQTRIRQGLRRFKRSPKPPDKSGKSGPSALTSGVGRSIIEPSFDTMKIDMEWSIWDAQGYSWWADDLRQRVEAGATIPSRGFDITIVTASTDLLRDISDQTRAIEAANSVNMSAGMSSVIVDPKDGTSRLVSSVAVHSNNLHYARMFSVAAAFQIAEATSLVEALAESLGGRSHTSHHPTSGPRDIPDEMLELIEQLPMRDDLVPLDENDFEEVIAATTNPQGQSLILLGTTSPHGLVAEFPFYDTTPAMVLAASGSSAFPGTALLTLSVRDDEANIHWASAEDRIGSPPLIPRHTGAYTRYGSGLHLRLGLPILIDEREAIHRATELNRLESEGASVNHLIGSWFAESGGLWFTAYYPNFLLVPLNHRQLIVELVNIVAAQASRVLWARGVLDDRGYRR